MSDKLLDYILRHPYRSLVVALVLLIVIIGPLWWNYVWQSPQNVFDGMLANNLTTTSVTKSVVASTSSESITRYVRQEMGGTNATDWIATAAQSGSAVTTESIGTLTAGYIRYTSILVSSKPQNGKSANFKEILNVWAKSDMKTDTALKQYFSDALLDVSSAPTPPIGDLPSSEQQNLVSYMLNQNVYIPSYKNVKSQSVNGQNVYTYTVSIHLGPYVTLMQAFAHDLGITSLDTINPSQYSTLPPVTMLMSVSKVTHQLVSIKYPSTGFIQGYSDWGLMTPITVPQKTITTTELQNRFQALLSKLS